MRKQSLRDDGADDLTFRHPRDRHAAYNMEMEYHQLCPHFFSPDRTYYPLEGIYRGCSAFLICNGPSFAALDHNQLRKPGIMTFGINNGPRTFRPNFWTCVDDPVRFIKSIWLDPKITKFVPQSHFDKRIFDNEKWQVMDWKVRDCPNVIGYMRNEKFHADRFLTESSLNWGNHQDYGGGRSVMLPAVRILYLLGFRKVYLLGCDMKMAENYTYHFDEQRTKGAVNCNNSTYDRLKNDYFPSLKPHFDEMGLQLLNCNPDSELKVFPFVSFDDAIKEATQKLGDIEHERVYGMYTSNEEKTQFKEETPDTQKKHLPVLNEIRQGNTEIIKQIPLPPPKQPKQPKDKIIPPCPPSEPQPQELITSPMPVPQQQLQQMMPIQPSPPPPPPVRKIIEGVEIVKPPQPLPPPPINARKVNLVQMAPVAETVSQVQRKVPPLVTKPPMP